MLKRILTKIIDYMVIMGSSDLQDQGMKKSNKRGKNG